MAYEELQNVTPLGVLVAGADLRNSQFTLVTLDANGQVVAPTGQGVVTIGVLTNAPALGEVAQVQTYGVARVRAGGALTLAAGGRNVTAAGTTGRIGAAASGNFIAGVLLGAAANDGDIVPVMLAPMRVAI